MGSFSSKDVSGAGKRRSGSTSIARPEQQQSQHMAFDAQPMLPQQQQQSCRPSRSRNSWSSGSAMATASQNFNDDDELVVAAAPAAATAEPEPDPVAGADTILSVSTRVEYSAIPRGQTQDVFGLIAVHAAAAPAADSAVENEGERQAMDLMCVLDVSGSMSGDKIQQVQGAVRFVSEQATPKDRLSLVTFNSSAARVMRLRKMDAEGKDEANTATLRLNAGGGTSIASGLSMALSAMEQRRQRNKVSAILLLTDGQDRSTRAQLPALLARAQAANCSVYAFGFGKDHDAALLSDLAEQAQTPFTFVEDSDKIREAFAGAMGGLTSMVAQTLELSIDCRVALKSIHTPFSIQRTSDSSAKVTIPDMFSGESRNVLVEMSVPAGDADGHMVLLESHVRYTDLRSGTLVQTPPVLMETTRVDEPQPEQEPDMEVLAQRERVEVTQALQLATRQCDDGRFDDAQEILDSAHKRIQENKCRSKLSSALSEELCDATGRMRSRSMWEGGGRAEVSDACQMHKMERCTNAFSSASSSRQKSSKAMFLNATQSSWAAKSKGGS